MMKKFFEYMKRIIAGLLPFLAFSNTPNVEDNVTRNETKPYNSFAYLKQLKRSVPHTPKQKKSRRRSMAAKKARRHHRRIA
jgi:hypothetical protein